MVHSTFHSTATGRRVAAALAVVIVVASGAPALANGSDVVERGSCSGHSDWKLKAKPDDGRLQVEGEVDSNRVHQRWRWKIMHNGWVSFHGKATTRGPSGSFTVERRAVDSSGADHLGWRATNIKTGETCRGGLTI